MLGNLYRWHIKRKQFKLVKEGLFRRLGGNSQNKLWRRFSSKRYYFAGEGYYTYEKPARRRFIRYFFLWGAILFFVLWVAYESYQAWGIFDR